MKDLLQDTERTPRLTIVIPAYNEEERLADTLMAIHEYLQKKDYSSEIIVVDDGSEDATADICNKFASGHEWTRCLQSDRNHGKGHAVREGVLNSRGEFILICDADLATPIEELDAFWPWIDQGVDVVIASRPLRDSQLVRRQPFYRELAGRAFNLAVQLLAVPGIQDTQCGFKLMTRKAGLEIFSLCTLEGFSFDIEMLFLANRLGYKTKECAVHWYHRPGSKVRVLRDGLRMLGDLVTIRLRHNRLPARANSQA